MICSQGGIDKGSYGSSSVWGEKRPFPCTIRPGNPEGAIGSWSQRVIAGPPSATNGTHPSTLCRGILNIIAFLLGSEKHSFSGTANKAKCNQDESGACLPVTYDVFDHPSPSQQAGSTGDTAAITARGT